MGLLLGTTAVFCKPSAVLEVIDCYPIGAIGALLAGTSALNSRYEAEIIRTGPERAAECVRGGVFIQRHLDSTDRSTSPQVSDKAILLNPISIHNSCIVPVCIVL